jgi:quinol monooxygenase YgiN
MTEALSTYLLSIRGTLAPQTLEGGRTIHNETAGAPANVATARSMGDLSHMVYAPLAQPGASADEFLILDIWNNMDGLNQFFANPHVQEQAGQIFKERDPVVWTPAEGFYSYHFPVPFGKNDRLIGVVRGMVKSRAEAQEIHNALVGKSVNRARANGNISHECYFRLTPPGTPGSLEFFAIDVWMDGEGMGKHYQDPDFMAGLQGMFSGMPSATVWTHPEGLWVEW